MRRQKRIGKGMDATHQKIIIYCIEAIIAVIIGFLLDKVIIKIMNRLTHPVLNQIFAAITILGEIYIFIFIVLILTAALMIYKKQITSFLLSIGTAFIVQFVLKAITSRHRPFELGLTDALVSSHYSSFPSGHTIIFFAMIPVMEKKFPRLRLILWITAILVGFSRMYLGVHYFSDVIAGAFLGYGIGWIFMKLEERYRWNI